MLITKETDYAIRIIRCVCRAGDTPLEARKISEIEDIPMRFTFKILRKLRKAGLVKSFRGVHGGYTMKIPAEAVSVLDILESINGHFGFTHCLDESSHCKRSKICGVRKEFSFIEEGLKEQFRNLKINLLSDAQ